MIDETPFRLLIPLLTLTGIGVSAIFRHRADRAGGRIPRSHDGRTFAALQAAFLLSLPGCIVLYAVEPDWTAPVRMPLPTALRWLGVLGAAVCIPLIGWLLHHLGTNVSPTAATRADHRLVTSGPYRFVRHPLYTVGAAWWLGLGVAMASWWILLCVALAFVAIDRRTAREEAALLERFGDEYRRYSERTPRYLPRWSAPGRPAPG